MAELSYFLRLQINKQMRVLLCIKVIIQVIFYIILGWKTASLLWHLWELLRHLILMKMVSPFLKKIIGAAWLDHFICLPLDIQYSVCLCARFQAYLHASHLQAVKKDVQVSTCYSKFWHMDFYSACISLRSSSDPDFGGSRIDRKVLLAHVTFWVVHLLHGHLENNLLLHNLLLNLNM